MKNIKDYWITNTGEIILIKNMTSLHICRTIMYLQKHPKFYDMILKDNFGIDIEYEDNYEEVKEKIKEFITELELRNLVKQIQR